MLNVRLLKILTTYLKRWKMLKHWGKSFYVPWRRKWFTLILNCELENVLVCAQFSSNLPHCAQSLCFITQLFRFFGMLNFFPIFLQKLCSGGFKIYLSYFQSHLALCHIIQPFSFIVNLSSILTYTDIMFMFSNTYTCGCFY